MSDLKYLTLNFLGKNGLNACIPALNAFEEKFGERALIPDVIKWLNDSNLRASWQAWILSRDINTTKIFLSHGVDIDVCHAKALYNAGSRGDMRLFKFLVANKINIDLCERSWSILADMCLEKDREKFVKMLLDVKKYKVSYIKKNIIEPYERHMIRGSRLILDNYITNQKT